MSSRFASAVSEHPDAGVAIGEVLGQVLDRTGARPDVAVLFASGAHVAGMEDLAASVRALLEPGTLVGASAESVLSGPQEVEGRAAVALFTGRPGPVSPLRLSALRAGEGWALTGLPASSGPDQVAVLIAEPFSFPTEALLTAVGRDQPGHVVVGGLASAARAPGQNRLVLDGEVYADGAVGFTLPPGAKVRAVVSQGCRPLGDPLVVTRADGSLLQELAGQPAVDRLRQVLERSTPADRALLSGGVHLGVVIDERKESFGRGDFLVRNVLGADSASGALVVADHLEVGTTVQFHVRDATTASEDLRHLLDGPRAEAALVFTCNGRGSRLFEVPGHDASAVHDATGRGAVAGMFCAGEIGPIGDRNFLHGFTASVLLFEP